MINKIFLLLILCTGFVTRAAFCGCSQEFKDKVNSLKWVAYAPTNFDPTRNIYPVGSSIRKDLELLYKYGFNGVITYGSDKTLAQIPQIAKEVGFQGVIMGIWDIKSREEIMNATMANQYVDGYCVGNEGLDVRYDMDSLIKVINSVKESTKKPVTTTEQIFDYAKDDVYSIGDWIFPNIHPFLCEVRDPEKAANWIQKHYEVLMKHCPKDRIVLFKEVGFPTSGMRRANEINQKKFFVDFQARHIPFVYFEAFDQTWKRHVSCEPHWGLFDCKRRPKKFASSLIKNNVTNKSKDDGKWIIY